MSDMLTIIYVAGLGQDPKNEELHGMRPLLVWLTEKYTPPLASSSSPTPIQRCRKSSTPFRTIDSLSATVMAARKRTARMDWRSRAGAPSQANCTWTPSRNGTTSRASSIGSIPRISTRCRSRLRHVSRLLWRLRASVLHVEGIDQAQYRARGFSGRAGGASWIENFVDEWAAK
jgi:hypothetical protein